MKDKVKIDRLGQIFLSLLLAVCISLIIALKPTAIVERTTAIVATQTTSPISSPGLNMHKNVTASAVPTPTPVPRSPGADPVGNRLAKTRPTSTLPPTPGPTITFALPTATTTRQPTSTPPPTVTSTPPPTPTPAANPAERFLLVDQDRQMMHVYENGVETRTIPVSTGAPTTKTLTPPWQGTVGSDHGSVFFPDTNLYADYMWYLFPGPEGSILIHSVPYTYQGEVKVYDQLEALGMKPVSHGCVRISPEDAAWLKMWNPVDVPLEITRWSGQISPTVTSSMNNE